MAARRRKAETIAIVGAGKLGAALARALHRGGFRVTELISREGSPNRRAAQQVAREVGAKLAPLSQASLGADVIWICVPDDVIAATAKELAKRANWHGKTALHSSGALSSNELAVLKRAGAQVGSAHPMMTFAHGGPKSWKGIPFAIEGEARAVAFAKRVAVRLKLSPFVISAKSKPLYHAVGSFVSPILVSLLSTAERVAKGAGILKQPREVISGILQQTVAHYVEGGTKAAFAGPMHRGDLATVRRHLRELRRVPGALEIYRVLATEAARYLPVKRRSELKKLLASASKGRGRVNPKPSSRAAAAE